MIMYKFAIAITKGDNKKVLKTFDNKDTALKRGKEIAADTPGKDGVVSLIYADIDDENNIVGGKYKLYEVLS